MNNLNAYNRPVFFYLWSFLIPCTCWLVAGYISRTPGLDAHTTLQGTLGIIGLAAPAAVAAWLFRQNPALLADLKPRLSLRALRPRYLRTALFLGPVTLVSPWLLLVLAPLLEELAWHSYGTDVLLARYRLITANLLFFAYWFLWHIPLAGIKGYYQANLVAEGWQYGVNFLVSVFMFVFIMNWVYAKAGRNVWIAVLFHAVANISNEIFAAHPASKIIQSGLFLILAAYLLTRDRKLFFQRGSIA